MRFSNITIFHGYGVTPEKMWFPWIHRELERLGYAVNIPAFPEPLRPDYRKWHRVAAPLVRRWDAQSLVIAHSVGGAFALRLMQSELKTPIGGLLLVSSPFTATLNVKPYVRFFAQPLDWKKIRGLVKNVGIIHAMNDPLVPYDHAVRYGEALGAKPIIIPKGGHFTEKKCLPLMRTLRKDFGIGQR
jgi:hypothetical protein